MIRGLKKLVPAPLISLYHYLLALLSALVYGFPSRRIKVIGITGTNGKTTTASLVTLVLEEAGYKVASLSSNSFKIGNREEQNKMRMTMPGRGIVQRFLRDAARGGCDFAVVEVTSEGIKQHRHRFISFDTAVFTNLSPEHIESHGSFEKYREVKQTLFKITNGVHILNYDDESLEHFNDFKAQKKYSYGVELGDTKAQDVQADHMGIRFKVGGVGFELGLLGGFNTYNALAAICVGLSQGVGLETCSRALAKAKGIPGRMELVISEPYSVVVDYAFTPNALEKVYSFLSKESRKMICVLGSCGGGRDKWKRPVLGALAGKHCDHVIVTNEDPYDEDPLEIMSQVAGGAKEKAEMIEDRREAIAKALSMAETGDTVVVTGKGSEPSICLANGEQIPWDDREVVREEFNKIQR